MVGGIHTYDQCGHVIQDFHDVECPECKLLGGSAVVEVDKPNYQFDPEPQTGTPTHMPTMEELEEFTVDPIQYVPPPWFQQLDYEPLKELVKSRAFVTVAINSEGDFHAVASWGTGRVLEIEVACKAATLDAALRDLCVVAIDRGLVKL